MYSLKTSGWIQAIFITSLQIGAAHASPLARDDFGSYTPGAGALQGQIVGGNGFSGTWYSIGLVSPIDVFADGSVGSIGVSFFSNAGNAARFTAPISINGGQLFFRYTHTNLDPSDLQASTRLDLNLGSETIGNQAYLGALGTDTLKLVLGQNLYTGQSAVSADSGIATGSGTGRHVVVGLLDERFSQIAIWVDPSADDYFNAQTGASSADAVAPWAVPAGGLSNFVSYSLVRNQLDAVKFDDVIFSRDSLDVGVSAVPEPSQWLLLLLGFSFLAGCRSIHRRGYSLTSLIP
jgi:hypothetical protein